MLRRDTSFGHDRDSGDLQNQARVGCESRNFYGCAGRTVITAPGYGDGRVDRILIRIRIYHETRQLNDIRKLSAGPASTVSLRFTMVNVA